MCLPAMHGSGQIPAHPMTQPTRRSCSPHASNVPALAHSKAAPSPLGHQQLQGQQCCDGTVPAAAKHRPAECGCSTCRESHSAQRPEQGCIPHRNSHPEHTHSRRHLSEPPGMLKTALPQRSHSAARQICSAAKHRAPCYHVQRSCELKDRAPAPQTRLHTPNRLQVCPTAAPATLWPVTRSGAAAWRGSRATAPQRCSNADKRPPSLGIPSPQPAHRGDRDRGAGQCTQFVVRTDNGKEKK